MLKKNPKHRFLGVKIFFSPYGESLFWEFILLMVTFHKFLISGAESQLLLKMVEKHKVILLFEMHVPLMKEITRVNPLSSKPHQLGCMFLTVSCKD